MNIYTNKQLTESIKLNGPDRYLLTISNRTFKVKALDGIQHFVAPSTINKKPKIYVVSKAGSLLYVGITNQSMSVRLRSGLTANGAHGYHGYLWGRDNHIVNLDIWYLDGAKVSDLEAIEAEVVYLFRNKSGQWPRSQTEIHFHQSKRWHCKHARKIVEALTL